jgi:hypothetical protein
MIGRRLSSEGRVCRALPLLFLAYLGLMTDMQDERSGGRKRQRRRVNIVAALDDDLRKCRVVAVRWVNSGELCRYRQ